MSLDITSQTYFGLFNIDVSTQILDYLSVEKLISFTTKPLFGTQTNHAIFYALVKKVASVNNLKPEIKALVDKYKIDPRDHVDELSFFAKKILENDFIVTVNAVITGLRNEGQNESRVCQYEEAVNWLKKVKPQQIFISVIDLDNQGLLVLPSFLHHFKIETLYLNSNSLMSLPENFSKIANLAKLYLNDNLFTLLPPELAAIKTLTHLNLKNNPLFKDQLPESIGVLVQYGGTSEWAWTLPEGLRSNKESLRRTRR